MSDAGEEVTSADHPLRYHIEGVIARMHGYRSLHDVGHEDDGFYGQIADAIIADLGIEQVGWRVPRSPGVLLAYYPGEAGHADHERLYRLGELSDSGSQGGD